VRSIAEETDPVLAPDGGAHLVARVFDNWLTAPVRDAIDEGAINGMSFRFSVVRDEWRDADGKLVKDPEDLQNRLFESWWNDLPEDELLHRTLKEVRVPELGPVVWPAYDDTSVGMRSQRVVIDLAAARSGDTGERRKLAEALYSVDTQDENLRAHMARGVTLGAAKESAPGATTNKVADTHEQPPTQDAPETTAATAAGDHPSKRRVDPKDLAAIRMRTKAIPPVPPSDLLT
jgi:hypothetical protein